MPSIEQILQQLDQFRCPAPHGADRGSCRCTANEMVATVETLLLAREEAWLAALDHVRAASAHQIPTGLIQRWRLEADRFWDDQVRLGTDRDGPSCAVLYLRRCADEMETALLSARRALDTVRKRAARR